MTSSIRNWMVAQARWATRGFGAKKHASKSVPLYDGLIDYLSQRSVASGSPLPFVLQVGANDGRTGDPIGHNIIRHKLPALLVEAHPAPFHELVLNYRNCEHVRFANVAVADSDGTRYLYAVAPDVQAYIDKRVKRTALGVSSFSKEHVMTTLRKVLPDASNPELEGYIEEVPVITRTVDTLLGEHGVTALDIVQVDIEGFDYMVIEQLAADRWHPYVINYEHKSLPESKKDLCEDILMARGYHLFRHKGDTLAFRVAD